MKYKRASNAYFRQEWVISDNNIANGLSLATFRSLNSVILPLAYTYDLSVLTFLAVFPSPPRWTLASTLYWITVRIIKTSTPLSAPDIIWAFRTDYRIRKKLLDIWIETEVFMFNWLQIITEKRGQMAVEEHLRHTCPQSSPSDKYTCRWPDGNEHQGGSRNDLDTSFQMFLARILKNKGKNVKTGINYLSDIFQRPRNLRKAM